MVLGPQGGGSQIHILIHILIHIFGVPRYLLYIFCLPLHTKPFKNRLIGMSRGFLVLCQLVLVAAASATGTGTGTLTVPSVLSDDMVLGARLLYRVPFLVVVTRSPTTSPACLRSTRRTPGIAPPLRYALNTTLPLD